MLYQNFYGKDRDFFAEKGCEHTAKEIAQQPKLWRDLCSLLLENKEAIVEFIKKVTSKGMVRGILTGAGSSGFVGDALVAYVMRTTGIGLSSIHTTEIVSAPDLYLFDGPPTTLLVSFARSGNSPESIAAVQYARQTVSNLYEVAIVCDGSSDLAKLTRESDKSLVLVMPEGSCDKGFAMTSSVSCMLIAGLALFNGERIDALVKDIKLNADQVEKNATSISAAAEECAKVDFSRAWYLGSGSFAGLRQEGALKMMELTNGAVVAGNQGALAFRHGPKTVVNEKTITLHFISNEPFTARYDMDLLKEIYSEREGNRVIAFYDKDINEVEADYSLSYHAKDFTIGADICVALKVLVFMQLLAMFKSLALGITTDNPAPDGRVNRVVQGVTIYPYE